MWDRSAIAVTILLAGCSSTEWCTVKRLYASSGCAGYAFPYKGLRFPWVYDVDVYYAFGSTEYGRLWWTHPVAVPDGGDLSLIDLRDAMSEDERATRSRAFALGLQCADLTEDQMESLMRECAQWKVEPLWSESFEEGVWARSVLR